MKIGIEAQRIFRKKKHGMDFVALELIRNITRIDHENEYVVFVKPGDDEQCLERSPNVKIVYLGGSYPDFEQFRLPATARKEGVQLLHCTSNTAPVWSSVPVMITLHDIIYMESISLFRKGFTPYQKFGNMYRRLVVPPVVRKSRKIITVSEYEKNRIASFFNIQDDRLVAVYNGVGSYFKPLTDSAVLAAFRSKYKLPEEFIFFLGNTDPKKNTIGVLKALSLLHKDEPRFRLPLVMLDYDREALQNSLQAIGAPELINNIILTGYVPNHELPALYSNCSVFLYPSHRESFGIPMIEAMSCGAPLIASNTACMPEIANDAAHFINPEKPDEIAAGVKKYLTEPDYRATQVQKGFQRAKDFSWEKMARQTIEIYRNLVS